MAAYSYKDVVYAIPQSITDAFIEEHGHEPDGDPNYDGDDWTLASMWIDQLQARIKELELTKEEK